MKTYRVATTVAVTSFATLLFQLTQTRILSDIFRNHAVSLTVSLALLGFGIRGAFVALLKVDRHKKPNSSRLDACTSIGSSHARPALRKTAKAMECDSPR